MKYLIINADDFGMSKIFNESIIDLIKNKKIKSTTVMVNWITDNQKDQIEELVKLSKTKNTSIGLHLEFNSSDYENQIKDQYNKFIKILNFKPSHLDIHKHAEFKDSFPIIAKFSIEKKLPCRNKDLGIKYFKTTDDLSFCGTGKSFDELENWIKNLEDDKYYEILFHPGKFDPDSRSTLNKNREDDAEHILKLNSILKKYNIKLISYLELK